MNNLTSLVSHDLFVNLTNYRNRADEGEVYLRRAEAEVAFIGIAVVASVECVARLIFAPLLFLPLLTQTPEERERYHNRVIEPVVNGILHNAVIALFALTALAANPVTSQLNFERIGRNLMILPAQPE